MLLAFSSLGFGKDTKNPVDKLLFLHGMGGTGAIWKPVASSFENDFAILAPDQRGHGRSLTVGGDNDFTPHAYATDVVETMEHTNFHPAWIVGHSMGVRTAACVANMQPSFVKGLVLVDLSLKTHSGGPIGQKLYDFLSILPENFPDRHSAITFMRKHSPDQAVMNYLMAVSLKGEKGEISFPFDKEALLTTMREAHAFSLFGYIEELGKLGLPILVLRGSQSVAWTHEDFEDQRRALRRYTSIQFTEIEGAGHGLPFEKKADFVRHVTAFVVGTHKGNP